MKQNSEKNTTHQRNFSRSDGIENLENLRSIIMNNITENDLVGKNENRKRVLYYNVPCAFDIETSSFYNKDEKVGTMYEWTLGINGHVVIGRRWSELVEAVHLIAEICGTDPSYKRVVIYVHNLAFEFQFMRKWFKWKKVFAVAERKPVYALTEEGIEFRCSYILSGYALASLGDKLTTYKVNKMVGDLDYSLARSSDTPMTEKELKYCENDVRVVMSYIQERIEADGDITRIPMTKTGYVRKFCRDMCMYEGSHKKNAYKFLNYRKLMDELILEPDEYIMLKRAFAGGFTHANAFYSGKVVNNVGSFDFTSSYPAVMLSEKFPMSRGERVKIKTADDFDKNITCYCCLFDIELFNVEATQLSDHPISASKCWELIGETTDNGRIVSADHLKMTITERDYFVFRKFYKWEKRKIGNFIRYRKGYLPKDFIKAILKLYRDKTELKGVSGREEDYLHSKEMLNSCYGLCVTDLIQEENTYTGDEWDIPKKPDVAKEIEKANKSIKRFLFYPWGVWVTAYARSNLFSGIYDFANDYVYSDTDSIKAINIEDHAEYIDRYNENIIRKLERTMDFYHIDREEIRPKNKKGEEKPLGVWDFEGVYTFKTLGAKRYAVEKDGEFSITVSGVNKKAAVPYMLDTYGKDGFFDAFDDELIIPAEHTGKLTHTYIDNATAGEAIDHTGNKFRYYERSSIHLEPAPYELSISAQYIDFMLGLQSYEK